MLSDVPTPAPLSPEQQSQLLQLYLERPKWKEFMSMQVWAWYKARKRIFLTPGLDSYIDKLLHFEDPSIVIVDHGWLNLAPVEDILAWCEAHDWAQPLSVSLEQNSSETHSSFVPAQGEA